MHAELTIAFVDSTTKTAARERTVAMPQLTVRNVPAQVVAALKTQAAARGRSAEAEHRDILHRALLADGSDFASRAAAMRRRIRSSVDSTDVIREARDRDGGL